MRFSATDVYDYFRPSKCRLRVYLRHLRVEESPRGPFQEVLRLLGMAHEKRHLAYLASLGGVLDLAGLDAEARQRRTLEAISAGVPVIYQGRFTASADIGGEPCDVIGEPDFLIRASGGYVVRDSKLAQRITQAAHPEILLQLQLYGWLYEKNVGFPPAGLEVHAGNGEIVAIPYDAGAAALDHFRSQREARREQVEFYEPVGWSKCGGCGFSKRCWSRAEESRDAAILPAVHQDFARTLQRRGVTAYVDLPAAIDDPAFRDLFYEKRKKDPKRHGVTEKILRNVEAFTSGKPLWIAAPALPEVGNFAVLDLEGMPPYFDELEKIYLWGIKVFGQTPSGCLQALAGFGPEGDRQGWQDFLRLASQLRDQYGDLPIVHWGGYERTKLDLYVRRFGDPDGVAAWVLDRLLNLHKVVGESVVLPVPSYSLKVVEKFVGFVRKLPEGGGDWAIAKYIEAIETSNSAERAAIMSEILAYNEEDLDATWAVLTWMRNRGAGGVE